MTREIARADLRTAQRGERQRVVVDRKWDRTARRHRYEVLVTNETGGLIFCRVNDTTDKADAMRSFQEIAREWGKEVPHVQP